MAIEGCVSAEFVGLTSMQTNFWLATRLGILEAILQSYRIGNPKFWLAIERQESKRGMSILMEVLWSESNIAVRANAPRSALLLLRA